MNYTNRVFPYVLLRLSGGSMDQLSSLNLSKTALFLDNIALVRDRINAVKNKINDSLYLTISSQSDGLLQKKMLNLKRDIFNQRNIDIDLYHSIKQFLGCDSIQNIDEYIGLLNEYNVKKKEGESIFEEEQIFAHTKLKEIYQNEMLQKGLLLSSQSLLNRIESYSKKETSEQRKKEAQVEQGLIKYITRMHAKTSPFSTFTNLGIGKVSDANHADFFKDKDITQSQVISHIRLNNFLYQYLKTLLTKNKEIYQWLLIRPNPTIQNNEEQFLYLTNNNNIEAFQRIPFNQVVELFRDLTLEKAGGIVYRDLVNLIIKEEYIDAGVDEIESYLNQLIEYGFFEFNIGVSGIDTDWDKALIEKISPIESKYTLLKDLTEVLVQMRLYANEYANAKVNERKKILVQSFQIFRSICMKLHEAAGLPADERKPIEQLEKEAREKAIADKANKKKEKNEKAEEKTEAKEEIKNEKKEEIVFKHTSSTFFNFKPEQIFYEDTSIDKEFELNKRDLESFVSNLDDLLAQMSLFEGYYDERKRMAHFFFNKYGQDKEIELLTFYEDYFREFKKTEIDFYDTKNKENYKIVEEYKEKEKTVVDNPEEIKKLRIELQEKTKIELPEEFKVKAVEERSEFMKAWYDKVGKELEGLKKSGETKIELDLKFLNKINAEIKLPSISDDLQGSYGSFVQFFEEKQPDGSRKLMGVLNASFPGNGKLISRFLHIFNTEVTNEVRKWNLTLQPENSLFIEDCDASYFNANLHPPLMPGEIWMPNGHNSLPAEDQIPVTDLMVSYKKETNNLKLSQKHTGKEIAVFDLGFQGHGGRSQLFQLLDKFSKTNIISWHPLINAIQQPKKEDGPSSEQSPLLEQEKKDTPATANDKGLKPKQVTVNPRLLVNDQLVIQRRSWNIPKELLPIRKNTQTDWDFFEFINVWRRQNNIPDEVFVFIYSQNQRIENNTKSKEVKRIGRDDYKPQYICFSNPYLINLLEKMMLKVPVSMRIEEMLPNSQQLFQFGKNRHIAEFVVQWYKYKME